MWCQLSLPQTDQCNFCPGSARGTIGVAEGMVGVARRRLCSAGAIGVRAGNVEEVWRKGCFYYRRRCSKSVVGDQAALRENGWGSMELQPMWFLSRSLENSYKARRQEEELVNMIKQLLRYHGITSITSCKIRTRENILYVFREKLPDSDRCWTAEQSLHLAVLGLRFSDECRQVKQTRQTNKVSKANEGPWSSEWFSLRSLVCYYLLNTRQNGK